MNLFSIIHKYQTFRALSKGIIYRICIPQNIGKKVKIGINVRMYHNVKLSDYVSIDDNVEFRCNKNVRIEIGYGTSINRNCVVFGKVLIGSNTMIAPGCMIVGVNHTFPTQSH